MTDKQLRYLGFAGVGAVYFLGGLLDVMEIDAAQYASISKEMLETGQFLELKHRHQDYLDKPPLLFWSAALFFKLFGISNLAYRLPAFLFTVLGAYSAYRFAKLYYAERAAYLSALVLVSCQAFFLTNHDVRTDGILANCVMFSIWQLAEFNLSKKIVHIGWGFFGMGLAMLAKGPVGVIVPAAALATDFVLKRQWGGFFRWQWVVGLFVLALTISPFCYGLYTQYDAQPGKFVYGITVDSGIKFYLWTQSFGRITGDSTWDNNAPITFQAESFLWSFLPWTLLFYPAIFLAGKQMVQQRFRLTPAQEGMSFGGFLLPFIALSASRYQLPHYTYVVFPLAAVMAGNFIHQLIENESYKKLYRFALYAQAVTVTVLFLVVALLCAWAFPLTNLWIIAGGLLGLAACLYFIFKSKNKFQRLVMPFLAAIVGCNFLLNAHVYPNLFGFQTGSLVARYARYEAGIPVDRLVAFKTHAHSLDFYSEGILKEAKDAQQLMELGKGQTHWVYTDQVGLDEMKTLPLAQLEVVKTFERFHISKLKPKFLNPATRKQTLQAIYLVAYRTE